jgi:fructose-1,6-bisphosphatase I
VSSGRRYSTGSWGSLVGDVDGGLLEGGVYLYPADAASGKPSGKIRLLYESHPLAFVVEQAGGRASTGRARVHDLVPRKLHERIPVAIGGAVEIELYERFIREQGAAGRV